MTQMFLTVTISGLPFVNHNNELISGITAFFVENGLCSN